MVTIRLFCVPYGIASIRRKLLVFLDRDFMTNVRTKNLGQLGKSEKFTIYRLLIKSSDSSLIFT